MTIDGNTYSHESVTDHSIRLHQQLAKDRENRAEMQSLIDSMNELRQRYVNACLDRDMCAAARDAAFEIMRENQARLPLSRAEINARINDSMDKARSDYQSALNGGSR